jgi:hypothetical protein
LTGERRSRTASVAHGPLLDNSVPTSKWVTGLVTTHRNGLLIRHPLRDSSSRDPSVCANPRSGASDPVSSWGLRLEVMTLCVALRWSSLSSQAQLEKDSAAKHGQEPRPAARAAASSESSRVRAADRAGTAVDGVPARWPVAGAAELIDIWQPDAMAARLLCLALLDNRARLACRPARRGRRGGRRDTGARAGDSRRRCGARPSAGSRTRRANGTV